MIDKFITELRNFEIDKLDEEAFKKSVFNSNSREESLRLLQNISLEVKKNPTIIYQLGFEFGNRPNDLNYLIAKSNGARKEGRITTKEKVDAISIFWETANLYKITAYYLSNQSFEPFGVKEKDMILKYFQRFGLSKSKRKLIRKIRNFWYHPFDIKDNNLVDNQEKIVCSINDLDDIYEIVNNIVSYNIEIMAKCLYYNRDFAIYFITGIYKSIRLNKTKNKILIKFLKELNNEKDEDAISNNDIPNWLKQAYLFSKFPIKYLKAMLVQKAISNALSKPLISNEQFLMIKRNFYLKLIELSNILLRKSIHLEESAKIEMHNYSRELKEFAIKKYP